MWLSATDRRHSSAPNTPPTLSRNNSSSSITSTTSNPPASTSPYNNSPSPSRKSSSTSTKKSHFSSLFSSHKTPSTTSDSKSTPTSRNASTTKPRPVKTAHVVGTLSSGHLTAAAQEMRHPHSGPPALHPPKPTKQDPPTIRLQDLLRAGHTKAKKGEKPVSLPVLTRIVSGDMPDPEDETEHEKRLRWGGEKVDGLVGVREHSGEVSQEHSGDISRDRSGQITPIRYEGHRQVDADELRRRMHALGVDSAAHGDGGVRKEKVIGGGWHLDERGHWTNR